MSFLKILVDFNVLYEDNMMEMFASTLHGNAYEGYLNSLPNKGITSLSSFLRIFLGKWHTREIDMEDLDKFLEGFLYVSFPWIEFHEEDPKLPHLIRIVNSRYWVIHPRNHNEEEIHDDSIEFVHEDPLIEKIVEDPPHVTSTETIESWGPSHDYFI